MHNLYTNFKHFFTIVGQVFSDQLDSSGNFRFYPRRPKLSDQQVIALTLTAEAMGIDSENYFWGKLRSDYSREFPQLGDRCNFNRRKRLLSLRIHELTVHLSRILNQGQDVFLIDSIPIPICKPARSRGLKICRKDFATAPDKGYSAVSRGFYTGYKLHLVISARGVFHCMDITKASIHDIHYLNDVRGQMAHCTLIGDKGYLNREVKMDLFNILQHQAGNANEVHTAGRSAFPSGIQEGTQKDRDTFCTALRPVHAKEELCKIMVRTFGKGNIQDSGPHHATVSQSDAGQTN